MTRTAKIICVALLGWSGCASADLFDQTSRNGGGFLPAEQAFSLSAIATGPQEIEARWTIAPDYYLYRHRLQFRLLDAKDELDTRIKLPAGHAKVDEHFGEVEVYYEDLSAVLVLPISTAGQELTLEVRYQGCAEAGLCYPPRSESLPIIMPTAAKP